MHKLLVVSFLILFADSNARVLGHKQATFSVDINHPDSSVHTSVLVSAGRIKPNQTATYHWYGSGEIHTTDGGFSGRLLHGPYTSYFPDRNLKAQGQFDRGLKQGQWITWYPTGRIHEIIHFSKGVIDGEHEVYGIDGNLTSRIYYWNGQKHGKTTFFSRDNSDSVIVYKHGVQVVKKQKKTDSLHSVKRKAVNRKDSLQFKRQKLKTDNKHDSVKPRLTSGGNVSSAKKDSQKREKRKPLREMFRMSGRSADRSK